MNMERRLMLHNLLVDAYKHAYPKVKKPPIYFQPPSNTKIIYPCIIYSRDSADTKFANNDVWHYTQRYQIMIIDSEPDTPLFDEISQLKMCLFERHYVADNLNHDVFNIYY